MRSDLEHPWDVSARRAVSIQRRLAGQVVRNGARANAGLVAGADCAYSRDGTICAAAVVIWDPHSMEVLETGIAQAEVRFPYIAGLLSFREAPSLLQALGQLNTAPRLLICDGHGVAHPRRFGLASHIGVLSGIPTVGCAKRHLCGTFTDPGMARGSSSSITDRGETIGTVLRTRTGVRPVFVSVGHRIDLPTAERMILACTPRYRLPEPLRLAHRSANLVLRR